jgi:hypothetical protein
MFPVAVDQGGTDRVDLGAWRGHPVNGPPVRSSSRSKVSCASSRAGDNRPDNQPSEGVGQRAWTASAAICSGR